MTDTHCPQSGYASVQAFHADRAALAATILARQLESQQIRGIAQPAQLMLAQWPIQSADQTPDAAAQQVSPAASMLYRVNAEPSTEVMWQPDELLTSSTAQHDEPSQDKRPESQLEAHLQLHPGLGSAHKEDEEAQQQSPPGTAVALLYTAQRQGQLKDSQESSPADGHQSQSELPAVDDATVDNMQLISGSSSPDIHRHAPEPAQPRPVGDSYQHQTRKVSNPARGRGSPDLVTEPSHRRQLTAEERQPSIAHESPLASSLHDDAMAPQAQISQKPHDSLIEQHCVSGRSTLLRPNHLPAPQADSAVSSSHSASSRQMPLSTSAYGQDHHDSEAWQGRISAQQANPKARIWSRQQLGYEDSSEAIKADASAVSHRRLDPEGCAAQGQLVSQGPQAESQQESLSTGARIDEQHPEQGTDTQI